MLMKNNLGEKMSEKYFDKIAGEWDEIRTHLFPDAVREKAVAVSGIKPGDSAADVGAGTGFISEALLDKNVKVTAFDQSAEMIKQLNKKYGYNPLFKSIQAIDTHLPVDDETVEYVFANMFLHHVENPQKAIKELARILKTGGKVIITDLDEHNHDFLITEQNDVWKGFKREQINEWFSDAGLSDISIGCINENCCSASKEGTEEAEISIFLASGIKSKN